jgi:hypothetical protein
LSEESNNALKSVLKRLENVTEEVVKTQGYTADTEKLKILVELTREQVQNENSDSRAR